MKNIKRGFTLIELLAVIVILSVIALIATPTIFGVIQKARADVFLRSADNIVSAAEMKYAELNSTETTVSSFVVTFEDGVQTSEIKLNIKGKLPDSGKVEVNNEGVVYLGIWNNDLQIAVVKDYTDVEPTIVESILDETTFLADIMGIHSDTVIYSQVVDSNPGVICGSGATENYAGNTTCNINSIEDLVAFSNLAKTENFNGKTIYLNYNLNYQDDKSYINSSTIAFGDINGNTIIESLKTELTTGLGFLPINNNTYIFSGTFNGNNKFINNLYINRPTQNYVGLFAYNSGTIKDLSLSNSLITGNTYTGSIAGYNEGGKIIGAYVIDTNVIGTNYVGGLVGFLIGGSNAYISNTSYKGDVTGWCYLGLVTGYNRGSIKNVTTEGNISGQNHIGGIAGYTYNSGWPESYGYMNGYIAGVFYKKGNITAESTYNKITPTDNAGTISKAMSASDILVNGVAINGTSFYGADGSDISSSKITDINTYEITLDTIIGGDNDADGYYFDYNSSGVIIPKIANTAITMSGTGASDDPYLITNYEELNQISFSLGSYYKLMNSISFSNKYFYTLSSDNNRFTGNFNGNGKTLSNIVLNGAYNTGIFGYNGGTITSVNLTGLTISGGNCTGAMAGLNAGTISKINVTNLNVNGVSNTGGIVGCNSGGKIIGAYVIDATITGTGDNTGGIAGLLDGGLNAYVSTVSYKGNVTGVNFVGLVTGYNKGNIKSVTTEGNVTGINYVGGIAGYNHNSGWPESYGYINGYINGVIYKKGNITATSNYNKISPTGNAGTINKAMSASDILVNGVAINGTSFYGVDGSDISPSRISSINTYEITLDTIIGGDNDADGYYFDYNSSGVIIPKIANTAITMSGTGASDDPYLITNYEEFNQISLSPGSYYKLMNNINFSDKYFYTLSSDNNRFTGNFNGNGKTLNNIVLSGAYNTGIFGYNSGTVTNFNLTGLNINGDNYTGAIAGVNIGIISKINVTNTVVNGSNYTGGIVGNNTGSGSVKGMNIKTLAVTATGTHTGGVVGYNQGSSTNVSDIYVSGNIVGTTYTGLVIGYNYGNASDVMSEGNVTGTNYVGGIAGYTYDSGWPSSWGYTNGSIRGSLYRGGAIVGTANVYRISAKDNNPLSEGVALATSTINGSTVISANTYDPNGINSTAEALLETTIYTNYASFNFTDTTTLEFIWKLSGTSISVEAN